LTARVRQTADERRETLLGAAIAEFAQRGYHGTPTEAIAKRAGISHAYLFRLYGTKKELFLAGMDRCFERTIAAFHAAAEGEEDPLSAMGSAYVEMLGDRDLLLFQLQTYAASEDPDIRAKAREWYERVRTEVAGLAGEDRAARFIGQGMLLNVVAALGLAAEDWVFLE
jgi:AcrR family transcriptional regulator